MADHDQNQGRNDNDALPESEAQARAGQSGKVGGDHVKAGDIPAASNLEGPAGDPAEGKR